MATVCAITVWPAGRSRRELRVTQKPVSRRALLTSFLGVGAAATVAAQRIVRPLGPDGKLQEPTVLSGSDLGFRVDGHDRDGAQVGTLVVRVDGKWVEARFGVGIRKGRTS